MPFPFTYDAARNVFLQLILPADTPGKWTLEDEEITEICLFRGSEGYETIFAKNTETGQWIRVYGNMDYAK